MRNVRASAYDPSPNDKPFWQNGIYYQHHLNVKTHCLYKWSKTGWKLSEVQYGQETHDETQGAQET